MQVSDEAAFKVGAAVSSDGSVGGGSALTLICIVVGRPQFLMACWTGGLSFFPGASHSAAHFIRMNK